MSYFYVNMKYKISDRNSEKNPDNVKFMKINDVNLQTLYEIFIKAFDNGDAGFYKGLTEAQKREFFENELGLPKVLEQPESHIIIYNEVIAGYTLALQYGKNNVQISCMCILPEFQNQKLGRLMLTKVEEVARSRDMKTISLGTEDTMKAFYLYKNFGFKVTKRVQM